MLFHQCRHFIVILQAHVDFKLTKDDENRQRAPSAYLSGEAVKVLPLPILGQGHAQLEASRYSEGPMRESCAGWFIPQDGLGSYLIHCMYLMLSAGTVTVSSPSEDFHPRPAAARRISMWF